MCRVLMNVWLGLASVCVSCGWLQPLCVADDDVAAAAEDIQADFYVSTEGNDAWSGTLAEPNADKTDGPFATIRAARDAIRKIRAEPQKSTEQDAAVRPSGFRVLIRGGVYRITEPLRFGPEDSGAADAPNSYEAYPNETPIFSGGRPIGGWSRQGDGPLWTTRVPAVAEGKWVFRQLFVNGWRATPARTPNDGYLRSAGPGQPYKDHGAARRDPKTKQSIHFQDQDLDPSWHNLDHVVVVVYHSWTASRHRIESIDTDKKLVRFTAPSGWPMGYWEKKQRYYVEFLREGLDQPGEWYLDKSSGQLTYYPRADESIEQLDVIAPICKELLVLEGDPKNGRMVEFLRFEGLSFQHTTWTMPEASTVDGQAAAFLKTAAVRADGARNCTFHACEIAHTGGYGLWLRHACKDNQIAQSQMRDLGAGGVRIGEASLPNEETLQTERVTVENCFIHDGGHVYHAGVGVWIGRSSHNRIVHNEISDFLYTGVSVGWSWGYAPSTAHHNVIAYNHIHHLGWGQLSDMGGIYCLGISPGTELRANRIHDVLSYAYGGWGLYTDEGSTDILMENNVVYRVKDGAFHQHYGRENIVRNNILALSATYGQIRRSREEEHRSFTLEKNIIYGNGVPMLGGNWSNDNFLLRANCYWDAADGVPEFPGGKTLEQWQAEDHDKDSIAADPGFADAQNADFSLPDDSPAYKVGFQPIDVSQIGLQGPDSWTGLPAEVQRPKLRLPGEEVAE